MPRAGGSAGGFRAGVPVDGESLDPIAMPSAPLPQDEAQRLETLQRLRVLDTPPEPAFNEVTHLAALGMAAPMAAVSLVDRDRQWFKSSCGICVPQTERSTAFCSYVVWTGRPLVVPDAARDTRFADLRIVREGQVSFYAGVPLRVDGRCVGALCVMDSRPRRATSEELSRLSSLGVITSALLSWRRDQGS